MATTTKLQGYLYDATGAVVKRGQLRLRLQDKIVSFDGTTVVPFLITCSLEPLATPSGITVTPQGTTGATSRGYRVSAVDAAGNETLASATVSIATGHATPSVTNYNTIAWAAVSGAVSYKVYGRAAGSEQLLATVATTTYDDTGAATPSGALPTENTTGGYIEQDVYATVGATPDGLAYIVEYDPDPTDTSKPINQKDGYWRNNWAVPNIATVPLGNFAQANRGEPLANYLPVGATVSALDDSVTLGGVAEDTTKRIKANQVGTNKPEIRFNPSTVKWELSHDGVAFEEIATPSTGDITGVTAGSGLTGGGTSGTVSLAVADIVNGHISASAAIEWAKISKTGSSLADLTTRSASDLDSGTLLSARLSGAYTGITGVGTLTGLTLSGAGLFADGTSSLPSIARAADTSTGIWFNNNGMIISQGGSNRWAFRNATTVGFQIGATLPISWSDTNTTTGGAGDLFLWRDGAANVLAQRNGTTAQRFNIYNTYTDASNFERLSFTWTSNQARIQTSAAGTGTNRTLVLGAGNEHWQIPTTGHFLAFTDNSYDIGASGATRPRSIYVGTNITVGNDIVLGTGDITATNYRIRGTASGVIRLTNSAGTDLSMVALGGTTSSFPAIKRSGAAAQFRLADDSGYAEIYSGRVNVYSRHLDIGDTEATAGARTDATTKWGQIVAPHYTNAEESTHLIGGYNSSSGNGVYIGGGLSASYNTATQIYFATAANNTTTLGTIRWTINSSGHLLTGTDNAYDIGASGATRPRRGFFADYVMAGSAANPGSGYFAASGGYAAGTNPASAGAVRLANAGWIAARNAANSADVNLARVNSSNAVEFGAATHHVDGTAGAPGISFASDPATGLRLSAANHLGFVSGGSERMKVAASDVRMLPTQSFGWSASGLGSLDVILQRDAANTLALVNGTSAQMFRAYNTYTDSSNYERLSLGYSSNVARLVTEFAGTGVARSLAIGTEGGGVINFQTFGSARWQINTSGHFLAVTDNTYDIGASGATRPRNIYTAGDLYVSGQATISTNGDGVIRLGNNAKSDFTRLQFGGTTSSFPAWTRSTTGLVAQLADASARTWLGASYLDIGTSAATAGAVRLANAAWIAARNAANSADINLARINSAGFVEFGSNAAHVDGNSTNPAITFASDTTRGFYALGSSSVGYADAGNTYLVLGGSGITTTSGTGFQWSSSTTDATATADLFLLRGGAGILEQRNGTNAQSLNVYNTYTDGSNWERLSLNWSSNVMVIRTQAAGTGTVRSMFFDAADFTFRTSGTSRWQINSSGHLLAATDNSFDIGASGATRPRHYYGAGNGTFGGNVVAGQGVYATATGGFGSSSLGYFAFQTDGVLRVTSNAGTDFTRLQFGGTTSSFPALRRSSARLDVVLADNSAYADLSASVVHGWSALSTGTNAASAGAVRLANAAWVTSRNAANSADINMIRVNSSNQVELGTSLAATSGGTGLSTYTTGDTIYAPTANTLAALPIGTLGQLLKVGASGTPEWGDPDAASGHALLGSAHTDVTAAAVQRGDLITGQTATPAWTRLAKGAAGTFLRSDGTDLAWGTDGSALTALNATQLTSGTVPLARLVDITNTEISASAAIAWSKISKTSSSLADLATRSAADLSSGTLPDARFPATLPAASGANLTALNASNLGSGTVPDARFPATLPAASGANLTALNASNLASGTIPDARFPATLPAVSGANLTNLPSSLVLLGSATVSGGAVSLPGLSTSAYKSLLVVIEGAQPVVDGNLIHLRLNNDSSSVYKWHAQFLSASSTSYAANASNGITSFSVHTSGVGGNAAGETMWATWWLTNDNTIHQIHGTWSFRNNDGDLRGGSFIGQYAGASAEITRLDLSASGNIASGARLTVYGLKTS